MATATLDTQWPCRVTYSLPELEQRPPRDGDVREVDETRELFWHGTWHKIPTLHQLERMARSGAASTPAWTIVPPGHKDSWLSLLHLATP